MATQPCKHIIWNFGHNHDYFCNFFRHNVFYNPMDLKLTLISDLFATGAIQGRVETEAVAMHKLNGVGRVNLITAEVS